MAVLKIALDGDGAWADLAGLPPERVVNLMAPDATVLELTALPHGTAAGRVAVGLRLTLPDGRVVVTQTTLRMLVVAVRAIVARYGDPTRAGAA